MNLSVTVSVAEDFVEMLDMYAPLIVEPLKAALLEALQSPQAWGIHPLLEVYSAVVSGNTVTYSVRIVVPPINSTTEGYELHFDQNFADTDLATFEAQLRAAVTAWYSPNVVTVPAMTFREGSVVAVVTGTSAELQGIRQITTSTVGTDDTCFDEAQGAFVSCSAGGIALFESSDIPPGVDIVATSARPMLGVHFWYLPIQISSRTT